MLQRTDVLVVPQIAEAHYATVRSLIKLLPPSYNAWRTYHDVTLKKRGADAVVQVVVIGQFRDHMQRRDPTPAAGNPR